jgi:hypothetical protein
MTFINRGPNRDTTFRTNLRDGVWLVTKNHTFYGDYGSRNQAIASACYGARAVEARGGAACVLAGEEVIPHLDVNP